MTHELSCHAQINSGHDKSRGKRLPVAMPCIIMPCIIFRLGVCCEKARTVEPEVTSLSGHDQRPRLPRRGQGVVEFRGKRPLGRPLLLSREFHTAAGQVKASWAVAPSVSISATSILQ